jgi:hypothetical protein
MRKIEEMKQFELPYILFIYIYMYIYIYMEILQENSPSSYLKQTKMSFLLLDNHRRAE